MRGWNLESSWGTSAIEDFGSICSVAPLLPIAGFLPSEFAIPSTVGRAVEVHFPHCREFLRRRVILFRLTRMIVRGDLGRPS